MEPEITRLQENAAKYILLQPADIVSQMRMVWSFEPETIRVSLGENTTSMPSQYQDRRDAQHCIADANSPVRRTGDNPSSISRERD